MFQDSCYEQQIDYFGSLFLLVKERISILIQGKVRIIKRVKEKCDMRRIKSRSVLITLLFISIVLIAGKYTMDILFEGLCGNEVVQEKASPNNEQIAYSFVRSCGATTGLSYQLSILDKEGVLENIPGNTFISDEEFDFKWIDDRKIQVNYKKSSEISEMRKSMRDVKVKYVEG